MAGQTASVSAGRQDRDKRAKGLDDDVAKWASAAPARYANPGTFSTRLYSNVPLSDMNSHTHPRMHPRISIFERPPPVLFLLGRLFLC